MLKSLLLFAAILATPSIAAPSTPVAGAFGFDWLRPEKTKCVALLEKELKGFRSCEYDGEGTFGLSDPAFKCRKSERSEYFVYETKAACVRNFETMKANAP